MVAQSWAKSYGQRVKAQQTRSALEMIRLLPKPDGVGETSPPTEETNATPQFSSVREYWEWQREGTEALNSYHVELSTAGMKDCSSFGQCIVSEELHDANAVNASPDIQHSSSEFKPQAVSINEALTFTKELNKLGDLTGLISLVKELVQGSKATTDDVVSALMELVAAVNHSAESLIAMHNSTYDEVHLPLYVDDATVQFGLLAMNSLISCNWTEANHWYRDYATALKGLPLKERLSTKQYFFSLGLHWTDPNGQIRRA